MRDDPFFMVSPDPFDPMPRPHLLEPTISSKVVGDSIVVSVESSVALGDLEGWARRQAENKRIVALHPTSLPARSEAPTMAPDAERGRIETATNKEEPNA